MIIRNFNWADLAGVVDVINRSQRNKGFNNVVSEKVIQYKLERYFEAERDCFVAESPEGTIIGIGTMRFMHPDGTGLGVYDIAPEALEKEVGAGLVQATDARLREKWSGELPPETLIRVACDVDDIDEDKISVLEAQGYHQVGNTHWMEMDLESSIKDPVVPNDFEHRFFDPEQARTLYELFQELFDEELGRSYENWRDNYHLDEAFFDPTWWSVAWKGDEMVGVSICYADIHEEPQRTGWIDNIGVRIDLRRQGIGEGLLYQSLANFQKRGFTKARTRPDGNNPFAVVVLQRTGFWIEKTRLWLEKVLSNEG
ncbi:MAG: GNAT family N-acetyltransferase [Candidatus Hermodarchaeia archaeon]|jgi:ribosomal protein S18 acetylase RimI-like enzyme